MEERLMGNIQRGKLEVLASSLPQDQVERDLVKSTDERVLEATPLLLGPGSRSMC
jgi:hypothetical protein